MASVYGQDPIAFLALEEDDFRLMNLIIAERARIDEERDRGRMDYLAGKTAALTAQAITRWLGKNLPKMRR
ncbi:hypothetical protein N8K70_03950 [Microbacterium betulae]|uniref:Uncharacterized protein n=1 Tax=Microbacterium betulae TaxID=2981139 RepID=A0AA97FKN4_9MICO|nr:hypothetical protein [Microbacterium sp. AB]WOF23844.1 hypothetical protein N8K70_03950 [Microbacterium sp. AB]